MSATWSMEKVILEGRGPVLKSAARIESTGVGEVADGGPKKKTIL